MNNNEILAALADFTARHGEKPKAKPAEKTPAGNISVIAETRHVDLDDTVTSASTIASVDEDGYLPDDGANWRPLESLAEAEEDDDSSEPLPEDSPLKTVPVETIVYLPEGLSDFAVAFVSDEDKRPVMTGVRISTTTDWVVCSAADGYVAAQMARKRGASTGDLDIIIPATTILAITKAVGKKYGGTIAVRKVDDAWQIGSTYTGLWMSFEPIPEGDEWHQKFPDVDKFMDSITIDEINRIAMSPKYMHRISSFARSLGVGTIVQRFQGVTQGMCIEFRGTDPNVKNKHFDEESTPIRIMLMPMVIGDRSGRNPEEVPEWLPGQPDK